MHCHPRRSQHSTVDSYRTASGGGGSSRENLGLIAMLPFGPGLAPATPCCIIIDSSAVLNNTRPASPRLPAHEEPHSACPSPSRPAVTGDYYHELDSIVTQRLMTASAGNDDAKAPDIDEEKMSDSDVDDDIGASCSVAGSSTSGSGYSPSISMFTALSPAQRTGMMMPFRTPLRTYFGQRPGLGVPSRHSFVCQLRKISCHY